ncbi:GNAT family N-acetyltransferase [Roseovarius pelagicus]|uniref:GNAT family N-acetyltransferase n=1 Tax=Roseovarius pelagicus TaxID=2980108 RepID=A0ABY6DFN9_9RHOB|nr:GNAT family N-acetyltransferase [Roseovarius pelagicus]UXX84919.1 GNAT family N-acetyltransferase [Roseovarius pelagicus]
MAQITIIPGFPDGQRDRAAALYWQAFGAKLGRIMAPEARALHFFETILNPGYAISALDARGRVIGLAGFKTQEGSLTGGGFRDLARAYGWFGALWRAPVLSMLERPVAPGILLMDGICVDTAARGQGVGTRLLDAIKTEAAQREETHVRLDVIDINPRARALYERQGFVAQGTEDIGPLRHLLGFSKATRMRYTL